MDEKKIERKKLRFDISREADRLVWEKVSDYDTKQYLCVSDYVIDIMHRQLFSEKKEPEKKYSQEIVVPTENQDKKTLDKLQAQLDEVVYILKTSQEENRHLHNENKKLIEKIMFLGINNQGPANNQSNVKEETKDEEKNIDSSVTSQKEEYDFSGFDEDMFLDLLN